MAAMTLSSISITAPLIPGPFSYYLNGNETSMLVHLVRSVLPKVMIEIGVNTGRTARRVLDNVPTIETYIGIDVPFGFIPKLRCQHNEVPFHAGSEAGHPGRFWLRECPHGTVGVEPESLEPADAIFIDGDHSKTGVLHDSKLARALARSSGIIIWHDYLNESVDVTAALDHLHDDEGWPIQHVEGSWLAFMRT